MSTKKAKSARGAKDKRAPAKKVEKREAKLSAKKPAPQTVQIAKNQAKNHQAVKVLNADTPLKRDRPAEKAKKDTGTERLASEKNRTAPSKLQKSATPERAVPSSKSSLQAALKARKTPSQRKSDEKSEIKAVVARVKSKAAAPVESAAQEAAPRDERTSPTRSEKMKIDRVLSDHATPGPKKWQALFDHLRHLKPKTYDMTGIFEPKTALHHKVLGWGYILDCRENRMDVLFREGLKTLIMNFKRS